MGLESDNVLSARTGVEVGVEAASALLAPLLVDANTAPSPNLQCAGVRELPALID